MKGLCCVNSTLPASLTLLTGLKHLDLGHTGMSLTAATAFIPAINKMHQLQHLALTTFKRDEQEGVKDVLQPPTLMLRTSMMHLDLSYTGLYNLDVIPVADHLDLSSTHLDLQGMKALLPALQAMTLMQSLNLDWNDLDSRAVVVLCRALPRMSQIKGLRLSNAFKEEEDVSRMLLGVALSGALKNMTQLEDLISASII
ncbi:hypothetical protein CEUSTIGMA_g2478.t1 [Chlamydomonas eustigma]|uniref:Uncharacterized protein n=1 Tax=Chlamydomonas eustigma TaxID=1157962 RepID=A0A250WW19_9CHLO|nr:hypothetical protein CEUSTIGMA_g2478.t1 [Chlamydomonas eustigma]|eukprot:GAX75034.1 hypothetical protein CEUSTIGMA_g2478.t1 [Chlamydomonas eustigma]